MPVKITFLGGLNEIGKNMTMIEYGNDAIIVDCGMTFPDSEMLGIDVVIPDFTTVIQNKDRIKGIVLTHGHEDHIGGLPFLLKEVNLPLYGSKLTLALVESKLKEHGLDKKAKMHVVSEGQTTRFGKISVEYIHVNHSIPDALALAIKTPTGVIVHTGDFKIDSTPISGDIIDLSRFGALGNDGVLALLCDSTNVERPGYTPSERVVGESLTGLFRKAEKKRIIVATFSTNLHRIQQIMDAAVKEHRHVALSGRSMINVVNIASELGYLKMPKNLLVDIEKINNYPKSRMIIVTTGSQGEPMSALTRMASSEHKQVEVGEGDYIIISATPIPGNEKSVSRVVNDLMNRGCNVVYEKMYDVHTSGHACQEELKIIHSLVKPKFFIPVHGEQRHLRKHAMLAKSMGMKDKDILISDIGQVVALTQTKMSVVGTAPAGKVLVDGLGVGDIGTYVLKDRQHLSQDGIIVIAATIDKYTGDIVSGPCVESKGFVYMKESEDLIEEIREMTEAIIFDCFKGHTHEWKMMRKRIKDDIAKKVFQKTKRSPIIVPIIMSD
ncbi:MAG: ribonuclease J [Clostridia bacterium]|nr:ribonuclease J [Clostridia bacterium]